MKRKSMSIAVIGFMVGFFPVTPAWARDLDERIGALEQEVARVKPLEEELARLKAEQMELKKEATATEAALPTFRYRPGAGLLIEDAKGAWGIRFFLQWQYMTTFWLDDNRPRNGAVQGAIHPRRLRPRFNYFWDRGFHEFDFWVDVNNSGATTGGPWNAFKANYGAHFEQISPFLPTFWFGANPSFWMNGADVNRSTLNGGRNDFSLLSQGNGIILATQTRGIVLDWNSVPLGMAEGQLHLGYSIFGQDAFAQLSNANIQNDNKAFSWGVGIRPFAKVKNPWIDRLELSFGGKVQNMSRVDGQAGYNISTQFTRAQRVTMIATAPRDGGWQYYTPGLIWGYGPYTLLASGQFDNSHANIGPRKDEGRPITGRGWRIMHELWLWSPKGLLTGTPSTGGIMLSPIFDRVDVDGGSAMTGCGGCRSAHAINTGAALWYFTGKPINFGIQWDHWRVNKANADVATRIKKGVTGRSHDWNTLEFVVRAQW